MRTDHGFLTRNYTSHKPVFIKSMHDNNESPAQSSNTLISSFKLKPKENRI